MKLPDISMHQKRVVIIGAGFAGLSLARKLSSKYFQVILVNKNNYHQFQPLLYQVATGGLEPSSISFPLRKVFQGKSNVYIRIAEVESVDVKQNYISTSIGKINYDYLAIANGAQTNYFGMEGLDQYSFSMKSVSEALLIRNTLLQNYEKAINCNCTEKSPYLNVVIVGGGPTGVELAGAIAEMKNKILPKDYPELNFSQMKIYLMEAAPRLLNGMDESSAKKAKEYLEKLGVEVCTNTSVKNYDGESVVLNNGQFISSRSLIWAAGVKGVGLKGLTDDSVLPNGRILVDAYNRVLNNQNVFAIGDIALMQSVENSKGHPQVAPVAIQQANLLAKNLLNLEKGKLLNPFQYRNKGTMATVGRNLAVAELGKFKFHGFVAWIVWMAVHLMSIIGIKNRLFVLINWIWQYLTYDQSLRLIIKPSEGKKVKPDDVRINQKLEKQLLRVHSSC